MKKIMQINITCGVGSTGRLSLDLYNACLSSGFSVCFAYSCYKRAISNAFRIETIPQNIIRRGLNKYVGQKQKHSTPGTKRLIRYIEKEQPDLIHLHNVHLNSVNYPLFFSYLKEIKIPIVYTLHDCWAFTGGCFHFTVQKCEQYQNGCYACPISSKIDDITLVANASYVLKKKLIADNPNLHIVCVSQWLADCARLSFKNKNDILTIYNGINTAVFHPVHSLVHEKLGICLNSFIILGVANIWDDRKGLNTFIELRKVLSDQYAIVLVGLSDRQIASLPHGIYGIRRTDNIDELVELYSCASVFLNASEEETFGLTTVEAMACGTPAIVFASTASPELLTEETGYVIQTNSIGEISNAIRNICSLGKDAYLNHCVMHIQNNFSLHLMVQQYLNLYRCILHE